MTSRQTMSVLRCCSVTPEPSLMFQHCPATDSVTYLQVIEAGANALVAGSAVFGSKDYAEAIAGIKASKAPAEAKEPVMA